MRGGFSLAEMVIAVLILAGLAVVMVGVIPASVFGLRAAGHRAVACQLARDTLEGLREGGAVNAATRPPAEVTVNHVVYRVEVTASDPTSSTGQALNRQVAREVTVRVTWQDKNLAREYNTCTRLATDQ